MSLEKKHKLNQLLTLWPTGLVMTSHHLTKLGYSPQLIRNYVKGNWLRKLSHGVYTKLGDAPIWPGGIAALQKQLKLSVHIGGISALEQHGLAQYLVFSQNNTQPIEIFNTTHTKKQLPKWFINSFPNCNYRQHHLFSNESGLEARLIENISVTISSAERAILEILELVPYDFRYEHAYELSENLQRLRPDLMQQLLQECLSVKVKRLFLYLADTHNLPCFKHLNLKYIDLGKGKRTIGSGGHFSTDYQLAVPQKLENDNSDV